MADAADSKSAEGNFMPVQVRPSAPFFFALHISPGEILRFAPWRSHCFGTARLRADAADSKSAEGNFMSVRVRPSAPNKTTRKSFSRGFFALILQTARDDTNNYPHTHCCDFLVS